MPSESLVLGFDTSAAHCAAALLSGDQVLDSVSKEMARDQAQNLLPVLEEMLAANDAGWPDLSRIGVGTGPGNFTGIRISIAAARGLALSLGIPAVGVNGFDIIAYSHGAKAVAAIPAPRDQVYIRAPGCQPKLAMMAEAQTIGLPLASLPPARQMAETIARIAAEAAEFPPPAACYIKPADAAPARDTPPVILDDA